MGILKVFFADNIALLIDPYFEDPQIASRQDLIQAFLLFPVQIYFDFSGYVDMALGVSKIFGINLPQNFNMPYHATSITDFGVDGTSHYLIGLKTISISH